MPASWASSNPVPASAPAPGPHYHLPFPHLSQCRISLFPHALRTFFFIMPIIIVIIMIVTLLGNHRVCVCVWVSTRVCVHVWGLLNCHLPRPRQTMQIDQRESKLVRATLSRGLGHVLIALMSNAITM